MKPTKIKKGHYEFEGFRIMKAGRRVWEIVQLARHGSRGDYEIDGSGWEIVEIFGTLRDAVNFVSVGNELLLTEDKRDRLD